MPLSLQALCVLMSKQQDRVDQMNLLSPSFLHGSASLNIILEERLREVNALWKGVQMRASSKQEVLERCVQEQTQNLESTRQQEVMAFTENFSFLRSLYLTVDCCDEVCKRRKSNEIDGEDEEQFYDEELNNQMELHELFEGLASVEESAVSEVVVDGDLTRYHEQLTRLQVSGHIWSLQPYLGRHTTFVFASG